jgi:hypothetical protein
MGRDEVIRHAPDKIVGYPPTSQAVTQSAQHSAMFVFSRALGQAPTTGEERNFRGQAVRPHKHTQTPIMRREVGACQRVYHKTDCVMDERGKSGEPGRAGNEPPLTAVSLRGAIEAI